ncbi:thiamine pyrophosphate-dependent dehydrogenase E1 component subunit alpha [Maritimibacter alkaliphilus]|uniref:thiamine pyrophosphate-dependent dehydrogenase E1 component subunit alpha n=1 Tax=Maritimibacter alkaliphilus TaxID=404236 RepID=UPI001C975990|nr:thiamine pyrophosphate-dependent dehydrogenase E1 component subunit alpha [Maritimibacter alkaliphilus]MBY6092634.1 thiamine pyrophosphate-dependent dehydrogenase E1 component subunit alpha [Maritimibacter alkaliphilus]
MSKVTLSYPHPPARPDQAPDFSRIDRSAPGALDVPPLDITAQDCWPYAVGLIRVLDDDGQAAGPWADYLGDLTADRLKQGLRDMLRMRAVDQRMQNAQRQGKTSFYLQCTGEEAIGCGFQRQLGEGDMNFPTYRQQSLLIAADYPLESLLGQLYSNDLDPLQGRQLPIMHSARDYGFFSISGNLGTQYVQAVGWAMACALRGNDKIAAGWIGDGATASNDFHSALLSASVYQPPVVLNVVNNQWAISTYTGVAAGRSQTYAARALGYGIPAIRVDGNDYLAVLAVSKWAIERARGGHGPVIIEWFTYRAAAHSTSDDPSAYRAKDEAAAWPFGDPVERLKAHMILRGDWTEDRHEQTWAELLAEVAEVQKRVEAHGTFVNPKPVSPAAIFTGVYADMPEHLRRQRQEMGY